MFLRRLTAMTITSIALMLAASPAAAADPTAAPSSSAAAPRIGMGMSASKIILGANDRTGSFTIFNAGDTDELFTLTVTDFTIDSAGKLIKATSAVPLGASAWMSLSTTNATLASQQSLGVTFTITIPGDAAPGDHYCQIGVNATMSDEAFAARVKQLGGGAVLRSAVAQTATVVVRVPGTIQNSLSGDLSTIPSLDFVWSSEGYTFRPAIVNSGNVAGIWVPAADVAKTADPATLVPSLRLVNRVGFLGGDALLYVHNKDVTPASVVVLPQTTGRQDLTIAEVPIIGDYDLTYTLPGNDADGRATVTATAHITLINMEKVLLYVVLPIVVLLLLLALRIWSKRRGANQRARIREEAMRDARAALEREAAEARRPGQQGPQGPQGSGGSRPGTIR